jgi:putative transposase
MQNVRTGRHVAHDLHVHLAFVTEYWRRVDSALAIGDLAAIFAKVRCDFGADPKQCNGEDDYVHLLVISSPAAAIATPVNSLKGVSSRLLHERGPEISGRCKGGVRWSPSYLAGLCGGAARSRIAEYIRNQREAAPPPRPQGQGIGRGS